MCKSGSKSDPSDPSPAWDLHPLEGRALSSLPDPLTTPGIGICGSGWGGCPVLAEMTPTRPSLWLVPGIHNTWCDVLRLQGRPPLGPG